MSDIPERSSSQAETENQSFSLSPFPGLSRLNQKLIEIEKKATGDQNVTSPSPDSGFKPGDLYQRIYPSIVVPFTPAPATGDTNRPVPACQPFPLIPAVLIGDTNRPQPAYQPFPLIPAAPATGDTISPQPSYQPAPFIPAAPIGDTNRPQSYQPGPFTPAPAPGDNQPRPTDQSVPGTPILILPIGDNVSKPADKPFSIAPGPDGRIEIGENDFDKIGPKAKQVLSDAGVTKLIITPGQGFDTYEAELKSPLQIAQDPSVDGTRKLTMDTHFKADVKKGSDGTLMLDNIQGLTAESKILFKFRDAQVEKIQLRPTADGKSEITSTGSWNGISGTKVRLQPGEVFEKANILFDRMQKIKGTSGFMEIPPLQTH